MATREEIREGVDTALISYARAVAEVAEKELMTHSMMRKEWGELLIKVKQDLSDLGVVIKVERELPQPAYHQNWYGCYSLGQEAMLKWHNDSFEPLIEEE